MLLSSTLQLAFFLLFLVGRIVIIRAHHAQIPIYNNRSLYFVDLGLVQIIVTN